MIDDIDRVAPGKSTHGETGFSAARFRADAFYVDPILATARTMFRMKPK